MRHQCGAMPPVFPLFRHAAARSIYPWACRTQQSFTTTPAAAAAASAAATLVRQADQLVSWQGLLEWRAADCDERTVWGPKGPIEPAAVDEVAQARQQWAAANLAPSLAECGRQVLLTADPLSKAALTSAAWRAYKRGERPLGRAEPVDGPPARPPLPELVPPRAIPSMDRSHLPKAVYMLHNLAHVELNAVDLAWDTVVRFSAAGLPQQFYADFARVADDESRHLSWCLQRLRELGYSYGCMPAHDLLWEGCQLSQHDLAARLAVVPMSQEARGLDAGGRLAQRLVGLGDNRTAAIVRRIADEERAHVAVGVTWFSAICAAMGMEAGPAFRSLLLHLCPGLLKGPFNHEERQLVGLPRDFYSTDLWPQHLRQEAAQALAAAEGRGPALQHHAAGGPDGIAPVADAARLRQLAARLAGMLDLEAAAGGAL